MLFKLNFHELRREMYKMRYKFLPFHQNPEKALSNVDELTEKSKKRDARSCNSIVFSRYMETLQCPYPMKIQILLETSFPE